VVTTKPAGGAHLAALATVTGTTPELAQRQQQSPSIIVQDRPTILNLLDTVAHPQPLMQLHTETTPNAVCRSRPTERRHASQRRCSSPMSSSTEVRRHHRIKDARRGRRDDVNTTKPIMHGASESEVAQHLLSNRLDRIEGDVHRCLDGLRCLKGLGLDVGNPGAHSESQPEPVKAQPAPVNNSNATGRPRSNRSTQLTCWKCWLPGHLQRNCVRPIPQHGSKVAQSNNGAVLCGTRDNDNDPRYIHMQLNGRLLLVC